MMPPVKIDAAKNRHRRIQDEAGTMNVSETTSWVIWVLGGSPFAPTEEMLSLVFGAAGP